MKARSTLWTWDIESRDWDQVQCVVATSEAGDVERWRGPGALAECSAHMDRAGGTFVAHAGGIYDTLLLSNERGPWDEIVMSGSAVLCAHSGKLKVRDSFRWWLASLGAVGKYLEKRNDQREATGQQRTDAKGALYKKEVDRRRIHLLTQKETEDYCESDCLILLRGVQAAREYLSEHGARAAWTAGASAVALMAALEPGSWKLLQRFTLPFETSVRASECVRGARVECWAMGHVPRVYVYDFKSAYPAAYATRDVGIGARPLAAGDRTVPGAVWECEWFWPDRSRRPPATDQTTGCGAGWCRAWLVEDEIADFATCGIQVQRLRGWAPDFMAPIGQRFASILYADKEAGSFFAKTFINSWHGKTSEHPVKEAWQKERPSKWYGKPPEKVGDYWRSEQAAIDKNGNVAPHLQPLIAANILGRQRSALWRAIRAVEDAGGEVYYSDTDSIHTNLAPEQMPVPLGVSMGMLAFEGGPFEGLYCGPKAYCLCDPDTGKAVKGALKGMPWKGLVDGVRSHWSADLPAVYREAGMRDGEAEVGHDWRRQVFEDALALGSARIVKSGILPFLRGVRTTSTSLKWHKSEETRTLAPKQREKRFGDAATDWQYKAPVELLQGGAFDANPNAPQLIENDAEQWF